MNSEGFRRREEERRRGRGAKRIGGGRVGGMDREVRNRVDNDGMYCRVENEESVLRHRGVS